MKTTKFKIKITFTEPVLGSASNNKQIHEEFIAAKADTVAKVKEEVEAVDVVEQIEKSTTVFPRDEQGHLHLWDYQWRGFFKEAIGALIELGQFKEPSKWQYKKAVDSFLFVTPRRIPLRAAGGANVKAAETLQRPLRADTMRGERVALASSEVMPAGTWCEFEVTLLETSNGKSKMGLTPEHVRGALEYGALKGFGQWRSGGYGCISFTCDEVAK